MSITKIIDGVTYDDIVSKSYRLNPETDDLIFGDKLKNGMVVLIDSDYRGGENMTDSYDLQKLLVENRWCEVSQLRTEENKIIYFIGLYVDGQKVIRSSESFYGWIVKKNTMDPVCNLGECGGNPCSSGDDPNKSNHVNV